MDETAVETKPVIGSSGDEPAVQTEVSKPVDVAEESVELPADPKSTESEPMATIADKEVESSEEKMEVETTVVETAAVEEPTPVADVEPAIEESVADDPKGVDPSVEPVPDVSVKSPSDASVNNVSSPAPAVQSSTPPRSQNTKKPKVDLTTAPVRQYLDTTVVPILLQGLSSLARERPSKPIAYLANFLLEKASEYDE